MKKTEQLKKELKDLKPELNKKYKIKKIGIFGSYVKGENKTNSDLDILVEFSEIPTLLIFINLERYISDKLGIKVDLVTKRVLKPIIGKQILKEVVYL